VGVRILCLCDDGVNKVVDTALVLLTDETEVTLLTPGLAPRVLDDPVLLGTLNTITDKKNTVVKTLAADNAEDTADVELPEGSINTNRQRTDVVKSSDHVSVSAVDSTPVRELVLARASLVLALLNLALVRILALSGHTLTDTIGHSVGHKATVATAVADLLALVLHAVVIAINKLLLRKSGKLTVSNLVDTLHVASDRERPAAAARALVLNRGDSTIIDPVLLLRIILKSLGGGRKELGTREVLGDLMEVLSSKLLGSKVSKLSETEARTSRITLESLVHLENGALVLGKDLKTGLLLLSAEVHGLVLSLPLLPLMIDRVDKSKS